MSTDIKVRISAMGYLFIAERLLMVEDHSITAIDSTLIKAKGRVWHKSSMKKGIVPYPCIYTDARWWDYSHKRMGLWI
ncbi:MAG: hypothetical protein ABJB76_11950 [Candidatus Nitrosocosmicus sp.]